MDKKKCTPRNKLTITEKLKLMKEMDQRNEERRKEFIEQEKKAREEKLIDLYLDGRITKKQFEKRIKE